MQRVSCTLALLAFGAISATAHAGTISGTIDRIEQIVNTQASGYKPFALVHITGTVDDPGPGCNTSGRFAIDLGTTTGQEAAHVAQLLYVTGRPARILGNGTCDVYSNSETASEVDAF